MHSTSILICDPKEYDNDVDSDDPVSLPPYLILPMSDDDTNPNDTVQPRLNGSRSGPHQTLPNGWSSHRGHRQGRKGIDQVLQDPGLKQSEPNKPHSPRSQSRKQPNQQTKDPPKPDGTPLPRRTERPRHSNGYSQHGSLTNKHEKNLPTRRWSASLHTTDSSTVTTTSNTSGTLSTPTSPSQSSLPYTHSDHGLVDKEQKENGSVGQEYSKAVCTNGRSQARGKSHPKLPNIPLTRACQTPLLGCTYSMAIVFLASWTLLGFIFHSNFYRQVDPSTCRDTYMQPKYFILQGFDRERTAFAGKYKLLFFRDQYDYSLQLPSSMLAEVSRYVYTVNKEAKVQPLGVPALFIPGNAGSAKQMRSIAKEASKYYYENVAEAHRGSKTLPRPIDFFTLDFNEEFSALHGHSLLEQAQFLNDAIAYILSLYNENRPYDPALPKPTSVLLIGHSMGGIVARSVFTMSNYRPGTVNTIVTAATPHILPPVSLDFEISNIYDRIESFWSRGFIGPDAPLSNVSLISIAGGNLDITVNGESGNIHNIVPQSHGFTVFTSSIPHAWVGSDHVAILWCNQIATVLGKTLIDIVDASYAGQVKPLDVRMGIFRSRLLTGVDDHPGDSTNPKDGEMIYLSQVAHTLIDTDRRLAYPHKSGSIGNDDDSDAPHLYVMPIPHGDADTFSVLTDHYLGADSRLEVFLCEGASSDVKSGSTTLSQLFCRSKAPSAIPMPASPANIIPSSYIGRYGRGQEFRYISEKLDEMYKAEYVVIMDRGRKNGEPGFLVAEFTVEADTSLTVETTTLGLLNNGFRIHGFPERPSLVSTLRLPNIDNSLLTYNLVADRQGCYASQRFSPMLRQSSWTMYEDRYSINIVSKESGIDINFHGNLPYFDRIQLPDKKGIELRFWMDPTCPVPLSLNLQVDRYGSIGKVVIRYRMVVLVFTFLVVVLTLRGQFMDYNKDKPFIPFGMMISRLITSTFWKFSVILAVIAFLQSLQVKEVTHFGQSAQQPLDAAEDILQGPGGSKNPSQDAYERMIQARIARSESWFSSFRFEDMLLGANDTFFWFLAPVFFQISIGIVIFIWILLNGLVRSIAAALTFVSRRGGRYVLWRTIGNMLSKRTRGLQRRVVTTIILFIMVATLVPYQFAFVVAVLVHIESCVRSLRIAQAASPSQAQAAWDRHHYLMSIFVMFFMLLPCTLPVLMVWIRNISVQWYEPFSSDHRLDYIAPFIFFVEAVTDGAMVPRTPEKGYAAMTIGILNFIIVFLIMFGVRYSWQIYFMSRIWIMWLLVLQLKDTELAQRLIKKRN